jgi:hypothetical protein
MQAREPARARVPVVATPSPGTRRQHARKHEAPLGARTLERSARSGSEPETFGLVSTRTAYASAISLAKPAYQVSIPDTMVLVLKPADIYILAGLVGRDRKWTYRQLGEDLHVPHALVQRAIARAGEADLYSEPRRLVHIPHFEEFASHALRFVAPARLGPIVPGVPAAWAAPPMSSLIRSSRDEPQPVWPTAQTGSARGQALEPLHPAAVGAARDDPELAQMLSLLDSLRAGDVRVRRVASEELHNRLREASAQQAT